MSGHRHDSMAGTQNQGNTLGSRSCVRQSKLYRQYESGNNVKDILGTPNLRWDTNRKEGAYSGHAIYDHNVDGYRGGGRAGQKKGYMEPRNRDYEPSIGGSDHRRTGGEVGGGFSMRGHASPTRQPARQRAPQVASSGYHEYEENNKYMSNTNMDGGASAPMTFTDDEIRAAIEAEAIRRMQERLAKEQQQFNESTGEYGGKALQLEGNTRMAVKYDQDGREVQRTYSDASPPRRSNNMQHHEISNDASFSDAAAQADYHLAEYAKFKRMAAQDSVPTGMTSLSGIGGHQVALPSARRNRLAEAGDGHGLSVVGADSGGYGSTDSWKKSSSDIGGSGMPLKSLGKPWEALAPTSRVLVQTGRSSHAPSGSSTRPW